MKCLWFWSSSIVAGAALGIFSALCVMDDLGSESIANGPWRYNPRTGSPAGGMYLRAAVSLTGLLALKQSEAVYFQADEDSNGQPLRGDNTYRVEIPPLQARWWGLTAYGEDFFLIPNERNRYGFDSAELNASGQGTVSVVLAPTPQAGNWIPTARGEGFSLTLRLYNPGPELRAHLREVQLPRIIRQ